MNPQQEAMEKSGYVLATDAAKRCGVTVYSIYRWIKTQKIEATKVGEHWFVTIKSLLDYLGPVASKALGLSDTDPAQEKPKRKKD